MCTYACQDHVHNTHLIISVCHFLSLLSFPIPFGPSPRLLLTFALFLYLVIQFRFDHVIRANELNAIEVLMMTDELFR